MRVVILAGGFGTRLEPGGVPKALLPMNSGTVLDRVVTSVWVEGVRSVHVVIPSRWAREFKEWKRRAAWHPSEGERLDAPYIKLIPNGAFNEKTRRGAVADLALALEKTPTEEGVVVVCGDNLFPRIRLDRYVGSCSSLSLRRYGELPKEARGRKAMVREWSPDTYQVTELDAITVGSDYSDDALVYAGPGYLHQSDLALVGEVSEIEPDNLGAVWSAIADMSILRGVMDDGARFGEVNDKRGYSHAKKAFGVRGGKSRWKPLKDPLENSSSEVLSLESGSRSEEPLEEHLKRLARMKEVGGKVL